MSKCQLSQRAVLNLRWLLAGAFYLDTPSVALRITSYDIWNASESSRVCRIDQDPESMLLKEIPDVSLDCTF